MKILPKFNPRGKTADDFRPDFEAIGRLLYDAGARMPECSDMLLGRVGFALGVAARRIARELNCRPEVAIFDGWEAMKHRDLAEAQQAVADAAEKDRDAAEAVRLASLRLEQEKARAEPCAEEVAIADSALYEAEAKSCSLARAEERVSDLVGR